MVGKDGDLSRNRNERNRMRQTKGGTVREQRKETER